MQSNVDRHFKMVYGVLCYLLQIKLKILYGSVKYSFILYSNTTYCTINNFQKIVHVQYCLHGEVGFATNSAKVFCSVARYLLAIIVKKFDAKLACSHI